jgi:hypothetical protein
MSTSSKLELFLEALMEIGDSLLRSAKVDSVLFRVKTNKLTAIVVNRSSLVWF